MNSVRQQQEFTGMERPASGRVVIEVFFTLDEAEPVWRQFSRYCEGYAFQTYDWLEGWQRCIGSRDDVKPCVVLITNDSQEPVMLLPLCTRRRAGLTWLGWLGGRITDYHGPLLSPDWRWQLGSTTFPDLWRDVRRRLPAHDIVCLEKQPEHIGAAANPFLDLSCIPHASRAHQATLPATSCDDFLATRCSTSSLKRDRNRERGLSRKGLLEFRVAGSTGEARRIAAKILEQKSQALRKLGVKDLCSDARHVDLFENLCDGHVTSGFAQFSALELDGQIIATMCGLRFRGRYYGLMRSYDQAYSKFAPGTIMQRKLFAWCIEQGFHTVDFTIGDEDYKNIWCDRTLHLYDCIDGCSWRGRVVAPLMRLARQLKRHIKQSPHLFRLVIAARRGLAMARYMRRSA
jgi:CelD/BcsL family acetyltransferase involved in cellulose biosynthesis